MARAPSPQPLPEVADLFYGGKPLTGDPLVDCRGAIVQAVGRDLAEDAGVTVPPGGFWNCYTGEWMSATTQALVDARTRTDARARAEARAARKGARWLPWVVVAGGLGALYYWRSR